PLTRPEPGTLDAFLWDTKARGFSITGMAFMDAWSMDFERLRRCYVFCLEPDGRVIPFCACNLSDTAGNSPMRQAGHAR
ncbi:MAG: hypothetical protein LBR39_00335, partial [Coriobacteriales bacterium]|nr:hypothetical protein [Coriobacteriales bacterium]